MVMEVMARHKKQHVQIEQHIEIQARQLEHLRQRCVFRFFIAYLFERWVAAPQLE